jgi:hypothetical protein
VVTILARLTEEGRDAAEQATQVLNTSVFERPGVSAADAVKLTELLSVVRADAGDRVSAAVVTSW